MVTARVVMELILIEKKLIWNRFKFIFSRSKLICNRIEIGWNYIFLHLTVNVNTRDLGLAFAFSLG